MKQFPAGLEDSPYHRSGSKDLEAIPVVLCQSVSEILRSRMIAEGHSFDLKGRRSLPFIVRPYRSSLDSRHSNGLTITLRLWPPVTFAIRHSWPVTKNRIPFLCGLEHLILNETRFPPRWGY